MHTAAKREAGMLLFFYARVEKRQEKGASGNLL
jgi:hypothetical protein